MGSVRDLHRNFALAEFEVPVGGRRHTRPHFRRELLARVLQGDRSGFSAGDREALRRAVLSARRTLVEPMERFVDRWQMARVEHEDQRRLRVMNLRIFASPVPSRKLAKPSAALDRGRFLRTWNARHYQALRDGFDLTRMHGIPILAGERLRGPFTIVEGTTRLCSAYSRFRGSDPRVVPFPVLVGPGRRLRKWSWYSAARTASNSTVGSTPAHVTPSID